ncbi:hypothetical protein CHUAL_009597 [Chamberlinius hualienensis]
MNEWTVVLLVVIGVIKLANSIQMPDYRVLNRMSKYEERSYGRTMWVATTDQNPLNIKGMFLRLFYYMQGANNEGRTIEMTAPLVRHNEEDGNVTLMLYLPESLHDKPPLPTDSHVNITFLPQTDYIVHLFGGFATDEIWEEELDNFKNLLADDGNITTADESFYASYSGFHDIVDRRNEIWLLREATPTEDDDETTLATQA